MSHSTMCMCHHVVYVVQDMRTLKFAHKQESHGRRGMYERLQVLLYNHVLLNYVYVVYTC